MIRPTPALWKLFTQGVDMIQVYSGAYAAANFLIATIIALRIWWVSRQLTKTLGGGTQKFYQRIVTIILESGSLYPVSSFVDIGLKNSASKLGFPIDLGPTVALIAGIAPALMIVRSRASNTSQSHSTWGAGALSVLRFDSNTGTRETTSHQLGIQGPSDAETQSEGSKGTSHLDTSERSV
ncbi:hypothetical protein PQX77_021716 [Marasmius sp. AFHP31]|nr:hypothetical protein PQX77_021716 [Marasmius sp. AFHP31]